MGKELVFCWFAKGRWYETGMGAHTVDGEDAGTAAYRWPGML